MWSDQGSHPNHQNWCETTRNRKHCMQRVSNGVFGYNRWSDALMRGLQCRWEKKQVQKGSNFTEKTVDFSMAIDPHQGSGFINHQITTKSISLAQSFIGTYIYSNSMHSSWSKMGCMGTNIDIVTTWERGRGLTQTQHHHSSWEWLLCCIRWTKKYH